MDPFLVTKDAIDDEEPAGIIYITKFGRRIPSDYMYRLEYVFSADRKRFLAGKNDGTNLNGYLPFTNDNLLCGLGL